MHSTTNPYFACLMAALLSGPVMAQRIFTCVDANGRKITSDRPIAECSDRGQNELTPSGTVKRVLGPTLTANERTTLDENQKLATQAQMRETEEKRHNRALLLRFANQPIHDKERGLALGPTEAGLITASKKLQDIAQQCKLLKVEMEFYKKDPTKAPYTLQQKREENVQNSAIQKIFIANLKLERERINWRFDQELIKLQVLWTLQTPGRVAIVPALY